MITLVANGETPPAHEFRVHAQQSDHIIAVDGGADHCLAMEITPTLVIGDMDSISPLARKKFESEIEFESAPHDKAEMDLELGIRAAMAREASQILVFGWSSSDANYTYGNLRMASQCPIPVILINHRGWNTFLSESFGRVEIYASDGTQKVSVFPFSPGVSLKSLGLKWELDWDQVSLESVSQSNVLREKMASIALTQGVAWVAIERPFV